jgi:hypothetical protein
VGESLGVSCSCSTAVTVRVRTARSALPQAEANRAQRNVATTEYVVVHSTSKCMFEECVELSAHVGDIARPYDSYSRTCHFHISRHLGKGVYDLR